MINVKAKVTQKRGIFNTLKNNTLKIVNDFQLKRYYKLAILETKFIP